MNYLLDVSTLVAWGWADHADHDRVVRWISDRCRRPGHRLATSPIPELGFVRVSVQRAQGQVEPSEAGEVLARMVASLGARHVFVADDEPARTWPDWCRGHGRTTDAHLVQLAVAHGMTLATLDQGIPGAYVIPPPG